MKTPGAWTHASPREVGAALEADGYAVLPGVLDAGECAALASLHASPMQAPTTVRALVAPDALVVLCGALRDRLDALATEWRALLVDDDADGRAPASARGPELRIVAAGGNRPLAGAPPREPVFPFFACVLLSRPHTDFSGGELVLVEQRPRMQSRPVVVHAGPGDVIVVPSRRRPVRGTRGVYSVLTRHAVSRVHAGRRIDALLHLAP